MSNTMKYLSEKIICVWTIVVSFTLVLSLLFTIHPLVSVGCAEMDGHAGGFLKTYYVWMSLSIIQYIPRNMLTVFALLCFVVVIHWLIFPYPSGLLHWHCGNLTIAPVPAKQPWGMWINTSCEFIMNDCKSTTKQSTTKPCAYFLGYAVDAAWVSCMGLIGLCISA